MELSAETARDGNVPFAALLVDKDGAVIVAAKNTVNSSHNAAAHAEINLLYEAAQKLKTSNLSGYAVVSNAASCPMCIVALIKAKVTEYYFGAPSEDNMVPNISMEEIVAKTPFPIELHGGILADECAAQIAATAPVNRR